VARLVVIAGVRLSGENILQDPLGWLIPEVRFSRGHLTAVDSFLARPTTRGAVLGGLLAPLADALREIDNLVTLHGTVVTVGVYRAWAAVTPLWPWALVALVSAPITAATTGAADGDLSEPRFFFFFLPSWATAPEPPVWATPVYGVECHARPSVALAHLSARAKSLVAVSTSCVANFSSIFSSCTPWQKAVMMEASEIRERTL
jgi:hypothetical protein